MKLNRIKMKIRIKFNVFRRPDALKDLSVAKIIEKRRANSFENWGKSDEKKNLDATFCLDT